MITWLPSKVQYPTMSQAIIDHHDGETPAWIETAITFDEEGEPQVDPTPEQIEEGYRRVRQFLFSTTTDPLFFKVQRGEIEQAEYDAAVEAIRQRWAP